MTASLITKIRPGHAFEFFIEKLYDSITSRGAAFAPIDE
jgi:hypothetical protein